MSDSTENPVGRVARRRRLQRQTILRVALALFGEKGVEGGGLHEIAGRADVAIGTLYSFFPSREALVDALETDLLGTYRSWLVAESAAIPDPIVRIAARMRVTLRFACGHAHWRAFMLRNGLWLAQRGAWPSPQISSDIADATARGQVRIDADFAVVTIVGLMYGFLLRIQCKAAGDDFPERAAAQLLRALGVAEEAALAAAAVPLARSPLPDILTPPD